MSCLVQPRKRLMAVWNRGTKGSRPFPKATSRLTRDTKLSELAPGLRVGNTLSSSLHGENHSREFVQGSCTGFKTSHGRLRIQVPQGVSTQKGGLGWVLAGTNLQQ